MFHIYRFLEIFILTIINNTQHLFVPARKKENLVSPLFLVFHSNPRFGMLVVIVLFCDLLCAKVCCRLCFPDLQLCSLYHDFLVAQIFWENFSPPWLVLLPLLCCQKCGLEIHLGNIFHAVLYTWFTNARKLVILFLAILPNFLEQINRAYWSYVGWSSIHSQTVKYLKLRPVFMIDICQCRRRQN